MLVQKLSDDNPAKSLETTDLVQRGGDNGAGLCK